MKKLVYSVRLEEYEKEKRRLQNENLSYLEYERRIRELAEKWKI